MKNVNIIVFIYHLMNILQYNILYIQHGDLVDLLIQVCLGMYIHLSYFSEKFPMPLPTKQVYNHIEKC